MDLQPNKIDGIFLPITDNRISASEWNQLVGSCMAFITEAGLTPDASDNEQFLNAFKTIAAGLEIVGANTNLSNLTATGEARFTTKANTDLGNVSATSGFRRLVEVSDPSILPSWYKVFDEYNPSTGAFVGKWCEQGGRTTSYSGVGYQTITLLKPMKDTNYTLLNCNNSDASRGEQRDAYIISTTQIGVGYDVSQSGGAIWKVEGYIS